MSVLTLGVGKVLGGRGLVVLGLPLAKSVVVKGTAGLLYGGTLVPLNSGQSEWRRVSNATVNAGTAATLGTVHARVLGSISDSLHTAHASKL
jgi:hypothetical protein